MKRLSIALAAVGVSVGAFAALPAATDPTVVVVPQYPGGFVIGATAFYLQPSDTNGDLDYALVGTNPIISTTAPTNITNGISVKNVDPGYDWGWGINVGYIFPNTGNDVNLSYFNLDTDDTASDINGIGVSGFDVIEALRVGHPSNFVLSNADVSAKGEYDINQVDLTFGQFINVGCRLTLHGFTGLRWAEVERDLTIDDRATSHHVTQLHRVDTAIGHSKENSDFNGIGPIAGIDASYYVGAGFGVVGHFDTALLIGSIDSKDDISGTYTSASNADVSSANFGLANVKTDSTRRIVPVIDAKLGLDYTFVFNNTANSDLTIEAGWQVSNYFNAVDRTAALLSPVTITGTTHTASLTPSSHSTSDLGLNGPYVTVQVHV